MGYRVRTITGKRCGHASTVLTSGTETNATNSAVRLAESALQDCGAAGGEAAARPSLRAARLSPLLPRLSLSFGVAPTATGGQENIDDRGRNAVNARTSREIRKRRRGRRPRCPSFSDRSFHSLWPFPLPRTAPLFVGGSLATGVKERERVQDRDEFRPRPDPMRIDRGDEKEIRRFRSEIIELQSRAKATT